MFTFELKVVKRKSYWFSSWLWKTLPLTTLGGDICAPLLESELASVQFSSVQSLSCVRLFVTPWIKARQASLSIINSWNLPKLMSIESVMPSSHLILCCPLLLLSPVPASIRVFSTESTPQMEWPKYWSFSFSISPSNEHPGLISFRMDWLDLLAIQGTLKNLLQQPVQKHQFFLACNQKNATKWRRKGAGHTL